MQGGDKRTERGGRLRPAKAAERPLTYKAAGVDVDKALDIVDAIEAHAARTRRPEMLGALGGFGGMFALDRERWREPLLVAGADGVGTKLHLAFALDHHDTIGQDCVAMCVNDIVVQGAEPLFFLDYIGTGSLEPDVVERIVAGVADGCAAAGCALLGGETAEMPGSYPKGEYDIAGFAVGAVERDAVVDGRRVEIGDKIVGLASDGVHSNGYSLVRRILLNNGQAPGAAAANGESDGGGDGERDRWAFLRAALATAPPELGGRTLGEELLRPTRIYVKTVLALLELGFDIRAMAHITGGGLTDNIPRALPKGLGARLKPDRWPRPPVFDWLRRAGPVADDEMRRTFNDGIGFVFVVPEPEAEALVQAAEQMGERAFVIGEVIALLSQEGGRGGTEGGGQRVVYA